MVGSHQAPGASKTRKKTKKTLKCDTLGDLITCIERASHQEQVNNYVMLEEEVQGPSIKSHSMTRKPGTSARSRAWDKTQQGSNASGGHHRVTGE